MPDDHKAAHERGHSLLYHYEEFNPQWLTAVLRDQRVHCSNPAKLNDRWDCQPWFDPTSVETPDEIERFIIWLRSFPIPSPQKAAQVERQVRNAPKVVMASAGWINRHLLADIPAELSAAYKEFQYAPALSVNVAFTNWRFLYKLDAPAVRYLNGGFGWSCNIRRSMTAGSFSPDLYPDKPVVLTFYLGLYAPGHPAGEQGDLGRKRLLGTTYADYEKQIRTQMTTLFHDSGFRPTDIAGIVLNRWGHARIIQPPGFYYGQNGKPAPRETVEKGYGSIVIAHSELNCHQSATGALQQGKRAAEQVLGL